MKGKYIVEQIAKFVITYSYNENKPISNLELQIYLYYLWIEYYKEFREYLFSDNFWAWRQGVVMPNIYYRFCPHGIYPILECFDINKIDEDDKWFMGSVIKKYNKLSSYELFELPCHNGGAWETVFYPQEEKQIIPFILIKEKECR